MEAMIACLGDPDPVIRDVQALGAFTAALRSGAISKEKRMALLEQLFAAAFEPGDDGGGFMAPFAVLALAELARTDRIEPWLEQDVLDRFVQFGALYLSEERDYRGFIEGEGWRHGIAHGADLMMQLSLNPRVRRLSGKVILEAVAAQVAPAEHAYVFGEPARLARPVLILADKGLFTPEEWQRWFAMLHPPQDGEWANRHNHAVTLTQMHNLRAFALEIHEVASRQEDSPAKDLAPLALDLIRATEG